MKKLLLPIILFSPLLATSQTKTIGFSFGGGGGAYIGYLFGQVFEFYGGYSNLRGTGGGMRLNIPIL